MNIKRDLCMLCADWLKCVESKVGGMPRKMNLVNSKPQIIARDQEERIKF